MCVLGQFGIACRSTEEVIECMWLSFLLTSKNKTKAKFLPCGHSIYFTRILHLFGDKDYSGGRKKSNRFKKKRRVNVGEKEKRKYPP